MLLFFNNLINSLGFQYPYQRFLSRTSAKQSSAEGLHIHWASCFRVAFKRKCETLKFALVLAREKSLWLPGQDSGNPRLDFRVLSVNFAFVFTAKHVFRVSSTDPEGGHSHTLQAPNEQEKKQWLNAIRSVIPCAENYKTFL